MKKSIFLCSLFAVALITVALAGSARATSFTFNEFLSGTQEVPPNASPGTGHIMGTYNDLTNTFSFSLTFSGLLSPTIAAHLHSPAPPGTNAPVQIPFDGFPLGVQSGSFSNTYVFSAEQETDFLANLMYVNIHTVLFPGGEIRAQLLPTSAAVPEQGGTFGLMVLVIVGLAAFARWSRLPTVGAS